MSTCEVNGYMYRRELSQRLQAVERCLKDSGESDVSNMLLAMWNVRALQDESKSAGQDKVSELCLRLEQLLVQLESREDNELESHIQCVLQLVADIRRLAEGRLAPDRSIGLEPLPR